MKLAVKEMKLAVTGWRHEKEMRLAVKEMKLAHVLEGVKEEGDLGEA